MNSPAFSPNKESSPQSSARTISQSCLTAYPFVTWQRDYDGTGMGQGHYRIDCYAAAKEDFAERAGLVQRDRLFADEQLTEIFRCLRDRLNSERELTYEQEKLIEKTTSQIEYIVPDIQDRAEQAKGMAQELNM